jgi:hypothetical protein
MVKIVQQSLQPEKETTSLNKKAIFLIYYESNKY